MSLFKDLILKAQNSAIPIIGSYSAIRANAAGDLLRDHAGGSDTIAQIDGTPTDGQLFKWSSGRLVPYTGREILTVNRIYHVRVDGSDSNDGLADSPSGAFATIQKAIDVVGTLDLSIYDVTIQLGDGTHVGGAETRPLTGAGKVTIQGNASNPNNVVWTSTAQNRTFWVKHPNYAIKNFKLQGGAVFSLQVEERFDCDRMHWGANSGSAVIAVDGNGVLSADDGSGNWEISGNSVRFFYIFLGGNFYIGPITITMSGTPNYSDTFILSEKCSNGWFSGTVFSGSATGSRYKVKSNAIVDTQGGGASYLPGNVAGVEETGGRYI